MQRDVSPDHAAVLHLLSAALIAGRTAPYLTDNDPDFWGLDVESETMSSGEALLIRIASDLWTAQRTVSLTDVVRKLDAASFTRVVEALRLARGRTPLLAAEAPEQGLAA